MPSYSVMDMAQGGSGISEVPQPRVIMQGQLHLLTSTAQGCLLPQAETPIADPELVEFIHRRLLRIAPASLTLLNTSGWRLQAKQALVDQTRPCYGMAPSLILVP